MQDIIHELQDMRYLDWAARKRLWENLRFICRRNLFLGNYSAVILSSYTIVTTQPDG